jgi:hypothetical protein
MDYPIHDVSQGERRYNRLPLQEYGGHHTSHRPCLIVNKQVTIATVNCLKTMGVISYAAQQLEG